MRLVWRPMALADRDTIMDYIAQDNPAAAIELDDEFEAKAEQARQSPTLYKTGRVRGTREIVVRPNYVMVYRMLHAAQQWPPAKP
jgi:toxin ParE1/3/4